MHEASYTWPKVNGFESATFLQFPTMSDQTYRRAYPMTLAEVIERIREGQTNDQNDEQQSKHQPRPPKRERGYNYDSA